MIKNWTYLIFLIFLLCCSKDAEERGVSYYANGKLKHEVPLVDGEPEGLGIVYFENGEIQSRTYWKAGKKQGKSVIYFQNGNIRQENEYREGVCTISKDYSPAGFLEELRLYDSAGRIFDYFRYDRSGRRDFSRQTKDPIIIAERDSVSVGENYVATIRLGNRQFDHIEVVIGDLEDPYIAKKNLPLPRKDSLTSILNVHADSQGTKTVTGILIERSATSDSLDVIPFVHTFFVKPKK